MYLCTIEDEKRTFHTIDQTVDFVEDKTMFEVDAEALRVDIKLLNVFEKVILRDDCVIMRMV
jgi:hypothetical protein